MSQQYMFFDNPTPATSPPATDPNVEVADRPRLAGQNKRILERLKLGPATNRELAAMALKYTSRISDLRDAGYNIRVIEKLNNGINWYKLIVADEA